MEVLDKLDRLDMLDRFYFSAMSPESDVAIFLGLWFKTLRCLPAGRQGLRV